MVGLTFTGLLQEAVERYIKDATPLLPGPAGMASDYIWIDEYPEIEAAIQARRHSKVDRRKFLRHDERFPEADVWVEELVIEPRDPRHPNPDAGPIKQYVVRTSTRTSAPLSSSTVAAINAKNLHQKLVQRLIAARQEEVPNYGLF